MVLQIYTSRSLEFLSFGAAGLWGFGVVGLEGFRALAFQGFQVLRL